MFVDVRSQKVFSASAGRHIHAQMPLLTELASFFLLELYTFRAAGASHIPNLQNPVRSGKLKTPLVIFVVNSWV
jgi:hypothetical protein